MSNRGSFQSNNIKISGTYPVAFVGQPEYFRQNYFDAIATKTGFEFEIKSGDLSSLINLPEFVKKHNCKSVMFFRPEWLALYPETWMALKTSGVNLIGYSTEPIPTDWGYFHHYDQWVRLNNLIASKLVPYDLMIHFDVASKNVFDSLGFKKTIYNPLPVSKFIFHPLKLDKKFDVCFIGRSTDYREKFLLPLKAKYNVIQIAHGVFDEEANFLINQSKITLNLHNQSYSNFETRTIQVIRSNSCLISEPLSGNYLSENTDYHCVNSPIELDILVKELLETGNWQNTIKIKEEKLKIFDLDFLLNRINESL